MKENKQTIRFFNINWNSKTDGKGIRTVIFLQGCNLSCPWCHSPHSQPQTSSILLNNQSCDLCEKCAEVCLNEVHSFEFGNHIINTDACVSCGNCIIHCHKSQNTNQKSMNALNLPTIETTPEKLFEMVYPQLDLLKYSGGVTVSGGEPMLQYKTLKVFLKICKAHGIPTTVETSGSVSFNCYKEIQEYVDDWLFGLRPVKEQYLKYVADLNLVIDNLKRLSLLTKSITIRVPLIKGILDRPEQMEKIRMVMNECDLKNIELLPFNPFTDHYYTAIGKDLPLEGNCHLSKESMNTIWEQFEKEDIIPQIVQF